MKKPYKIAIIGCGLRGAWYLHNLKQAKLNFSLVAVADTDPKYADIVNRLFAHGQAARFNNGQDLIDHTDLDAVIIASPNNVHHGPMILAMERHLKVLLEKPVASAVENMASMWKAYEDHHGQVIIGFCLRYTPFYQRIKEVVSSGELGQILQINAEELMSDELSMVFARGDWRPNYARSGGLILEKCSHDMDLINWLADSTAQTVVSFAQRDFLLPRDDLGPRCSQCRAKATCRFAKTETVRTFEAEWPVELHDMLDKLEDDTCAYSPTHTYPDHQTVSIRYENGVLCNFSVTQIQSATQRTIHILGSEARLYGVLSDNRFNIYRRINSDQEKVETIDVFPDDSGHNGGDSILTNDFFALLEEKTVHDRPGLREGIEAALMCIASDISAQFNRIVELQELRDAVLEKKQCGMVP